jgi:hypothetical protein
VISETIPKSFILIVEAIDEDAKIDLELGLSSPTTRLLKSGRGGSTSKRRSSGGRSGSKPSSSKTSSYKPSKPSGGSYKPKSYSGYKPKSYKSYSGYKPKSYKSRSYKTKHYSYGGNYHRRASGSTKVSWSSFLISFFVIGGVIGCFVAIVAFANWKQG